MRFLDHKRLGSFDVTPLGLGTARHGAFWQGKSIKEGIESVRAALDLGVNLIDTADVYGRGLSERIVARAIGRRDNVVVMTKVGLLKTPIGLARAARATGGLPRATGLRAATAPATCFEADYVRASAHACLKRQQRSTLDVLLLHEPTALDLRQRRFQPALERLMDDGDVIDFGVSVRDCEAALEAMDNPAVRWLQIPVNVANTGIARAVADHPRVDDVAVVGLGVLGDGELLRRQGDPSVSLPGLVAGAYDQPGVDAILLGMSSAGHVMHNLAALQRHEIALERRGR